MSMESNTFFQFQNNMKVFTTDPFHTLKFIPTEIEEMTKILTENGIRLSPSSVKRSDEDQIKLLNKIFRELVA